jgi:hypothetical protein
MTRRFAELIRGCGGSMRVPAFIMLAGTWAVHNMDDRRPPRLSTLSVPALNPIAPFGTEPQRPVKRRLLVPARRRLSSHFRVCSPWSGSRPGVRKRPCLLSEMKEGRVFSRQSLKKPSTSIGGESSSAKSASLERRVRIRLERIRRPRRPKATTLQGHRRGDGSRMTFEPGT